MAPVIPHVTEIIGFVNSQAFANIPEDVLAIACARGTEFHRLVALHAQNLWIDEISESCAGFFRSFVGWYANFVEEVVVVEQTFTHPTLGFTGTPDFVGRIKGDTRHCLIDWKTPLALSKSWRLQLAAYCELARVNGIPVERMASLQPRRDGGRASFQEYTKSLTADWNVFRSALNVFKFFQGGN